MRACHKRTLAALPLRLRRHSSAISWLPMLLGFFSLKTPSSRSSGVGMLRHLLRPTRLRLLHSCSNGGKNWILDEKFRMSALGY